VGGVASPIYLFWVGMEGRFPYWPEDNLEILSALLRELMERRCLPRTLPTPELREPVATELNLLIFALLEFEARAITLSAFNELPAAERQSTVDTLLDRWEALARPVFWRLQARVQPAAAPPPAGSDYAITRAETTIYFRC
jgi:hypothetical protein